MGGAIIYFAFWEGAGSRVSRREQRNQLAAIDRGRSNELTRNLWVMKICAVWAAVGVPVMVTILFLVPSTYSPLTKQVRKSLPDHEKAPTEGTLPPSHQRD